MVGSGLQRRRRWTIRRVKDYNLLTHWISTENCIRLSWRITTGKRNPVPGEGSAVHGIGISDARLFSKHHFRTLCGRDRAPHRRPAGAGFGHLDILPRFPESEWEGDKKDKLKHRQTLSECFGKRTSLIARAT